MDWKHRVSLDWMKERQSHLTASEVKALLPFTSTGKKRKITDADYLKVYAGKIKRLTEEDCWSYGAAARGHLLEPYAIEAYNSLGQFPKLYHWDDELIGGDLYSLSYSPDALDLETRMKRKQPKVLGEVKSYTAERHLLTAMKPKEELEERWQIATAMAVSPSIERAYLILYNPDIRVPCAQMYIMGYYREDLLEEIEQVRKIETKWLDFVRSNCLDSSTALKQGSSFSTWQVIEDELKQRQRLNPM